MSIPISLKTLSNEKTGHKMLCVFWFWIYEMPRVVKVAKKQ